MTDAALPQTQRAIEGFLERYLTSCGAEITKDGRCWSITLPSDADTDLEIDGEILELTTDSDDVADEHIAVTPESSFFDQILDEAATKSPLGAMILTDEIVDRRLPDWLSNEHVQIINHSFTPYYDRHAACVLFQIGIETVSQYQREALKAVAIDITDMKELPNLADTFLEVTAGNRAQFDSEGKLDTAGLDAALEKAQTTVEDYIIPMIEEVQEQATEAAEAELEEHRQFAHQRRDEISTEIESLDDRLEDITSKIESASDHDERVGALQTRKELQSDRDALEAELETFRAEIDEGFPDRRAAIRDRHELDVTITPVTATILTYERGDLDVRLESHNGSVSKTVPYAVGVGCIDDITCGSCGSPLSSTNTPRIICGELRGDCCDSR